MFVIHLIEATIYSCEASLQTRSVLSTGKRDLFVVLLDNIDGMAKHHICRPDNESKGMNSHRITCMRPFKPKLSSVETINTIKNL